jgi:hypothetical protein
VKRPSIRRVAAVPILVGAVATAGCSTLSDNDAAARVGDVELSQDDLDQLLIAATPGAEPGDDIDLAADTARELLNTWILTRILEFDLAAEGTAVDPADVEEVTSALEASDPDRWATTPVAMQDLQIDQQAAIATWSNLEVAAPSDDELRALYDAGTTESGFVCAAHILVETEAEATDALDQLAGGADFAELAASESLDTASGADGGNLPCEPASSFADAYVPEFVEASLAADIGEPVGPVQSEFGYHVILLRPSDRVEVSDLAALYSDISLRFQRAAHGTDIYVDPRFGSFNSTSGVVAIG